MWETTKSTSHIMWIMEFRKKLWIWHNFCHIMGSTNMWESHIFVVKDAFLCSSHTAWFFHINSLKIQNLNFFIKKFIFFGVYLYIFDPLVFVQKCFTVGKMIVWMWLYVKLGGQRMPFCVADQCKRLRSS